MNERQKPSTSAVRILTLSDASCRLCRTEHAPGSEFCRPCALDLALIGMYERVAEWPMQAVETGA